MKVSIIIPVYKVEKYIRRCIDSVIEQDFDDYEIILVDDGSPDNCPQICDEYGLRYDNVRVIHKSNGGLSDARNIGINCAQGEYIIFIDSDDYVEKNHISSLYNAVTEANADIACSPPIIEYENDESDICDDLREKQTSRFQNHKVDRREAQAIILRGTPVGTSAWSKIYRKHICEMHLFPKGKVMEELATVYYFMEEAVNGVVMVGLPSYHYVQRKGSILNSPFSPEEVDEYMRLAESYIINAPCEEIRKAAVIKLILLGNRLAMTTQRTTKKKIYSIISNYCRKYVIICLSDNNVTILTKIKALLMCLPKFGLSIVVWKRRKGLE